MSTNIAIRYADIDHELHLGRSLGVANERMQHAPEDASFRQQPGRIPDRVVERHHETCIVQKLDGLSRHTCGKQGDEPTRHREDISVRDCQKAEISQGAECRAGGNSEQAADHKR